jgi:hypothetical protein
VRVADAQLGEAKSGAAQVVLGVEVLSYFDEAEQQWYESSGPGRAVYLTLTDATLGTPAQPGWVWLTLRDLGFVGPSFADLGPLIGQERDASMKLETNNEGKEVERWNVFRRGGAKVEKPVQAAGVAALNRKFAALLRTGQQAQGAPQARPAQQQKPAPRPAPLPPRPEEGLPAPGSHEYSHPPVYEDNHGEDIPF